MVEQFVQQPTAVEVPVPIVDEKPVAIQPDVVVPPVEQVKMSISEAFMKEDELANSFEIEDPFILELGASIAQIALEENVKQDLDGDK